MIRRIAFYTDHFRMVGTADDDDVAVLGCGTRRELLHSRNKGTSRVDDLCRFFFKLLLDFRRYAVSTYDSSFATPDLDGLINGRHALMSEPLHFLRIMDQRAKRANCGPVGNGLFDHLNSTFNAETKSVFVC